MFVIFKKKAQTLGKKSISKPMDLDLKIYRKSIAQRPACGFSFFMISISGSAGKQDGGWGGGSVAPLRPPPHPQTHWPSYAGGIRKKIRKDDMALVSQFLHGRKSSLDQQEVKIKHFSFIRKFSALFFRKVWKQPGSIIQILLCIK